jgi:putative ABC transport system ATP-binding protein
VTGPAIVFADEPTGSLDSVAGEQMMELLLSSVRVGGAALVLVTHDNMVAAYADREVRLRDGVVQHEVALS